MPGYGRAVGSVGVLDCPPTIRPVEPSSGRRRRRGREEFNHLAHVAGPHEPLAEARLQRGAHLALYAVGAHKLAEFLGEVEELLGVACEGLGVFVRQLNHRRDAATRRLPSGDVERDVEGQVRARGEQAEAAGRAGCRARGERRKAADGLSPSRRVHGPEGRESQPVILAPEQRARRAAQLQGALVQAVRVECSGVGQQGQPLAVADRCDAPDRAHHHCTICAPDYLERADGSQYVDVAAVAVHDLDGCAGRVRPRPAEDEGAATCPQQPGRHRLAFVDHTPIVPLYPTARPGWPATGRRVGGRWVVLIRGHVHLNRERAIFPTP
eukprot:scaffold39735_cov264-Isochrysis_galbana.AAC.6